IQLAATQANATAGKAIRLLSAGTSSSQSLTPASVAFGTGAVDTTNNTITVGTTNPITSGEAVVYHNGGGSNIGGLTDGQTYYAIVNSSQPTKVQLASTHADALASHAIALTSTGTSSSQSLAPASVVFTP